MPGGAVQSAMEIALEEAADASARGEVPVGAALYARDGTLLARFGNEIIARNDPTAHAEILCIREACRLLGSERLPDTDLYVTLEPCTMCASAISLARIGRVYFGAYDPKGGGIEHGACFFHQPTCHHAPEVYGGFEEARAADLLKTFFQKRR